jgi:hypothetical protein
MRDGSDGSVSPTFADKLASWLGLGPLQEEIESFAHDLIVRHGVLAYEEAIHLSEVARAIGSTRNAKLYRLAAREIEISFNLAWERISQRENLSPTQH